MDIELNDCRLEKMKMLVILLCITIGYAFGEMERGVFGKENLKVNEDVTEAGARVPFSDAKKPNILGENLLVKYPEHNSFVQMSYRNKDDNLVEKVTSRNTLPATATPTVKPSSSNAVNLEIIDLGKPAEHFKGLRRITDRNNTRPKTVKKMSIQILKSFLADTGAISHEETNLASNTRKILRRKRLAEVKDPNDLTASFKTYTKLRKKLPVALRVKVRETETAEEKLLESYATSRSAPSDILDGYKAAKAAERKQLKEEIAAAGSGSTELINNYKALRKGRPWNYIKLRNKFKAFFSEPSTALTEYETLKQDELASIDSFLSGSSQTENKAEKAVKKKVESTITKSIEAPKAPEGPKAQQPEIAKAKEAQGVGTEGASTVPAVQVDDPLDPGQSFTKYLHLSDFSRPLRYQLMNTDATENKILDSCIKSDHAPKELVDVYYADRKKEIELLKQELDAAGSKAPDVLAAYKVVRKGTVWNHNRFKDYATRNFFKKASVGRSQYEALKRKELDIDRYLDGSLQLEDKAPEMDEKAKAEEERRVSTFIAEKAKEEKLSTERVAAAIKNGQDPTNFIESFRVQKYLRSKLPEALRGKMVITNDAEVKILQAFATSNSAPSSLIDEYNAAKANEREELKRVFKRAGAKAANVIANYKKLRKGQPWNSIKLSDLFEAFFEKPSAGLTEYENLKRDELSIDNYLNVPRQDVAVKENKKAETDEAYRMVRAKAAERARTQDKEEWAEKMARGVRAKDIETVEVENAAYSENAEDVLTTIDGTKGATEIYVNPDNVTSADVTNTVINTTATEAKDSAYLLRFAIAFAMVTQVLVAILILGPQKNKLAEWCKRIKREEATLAGGEMVPLHTRKVTETGCKISKTALNTTLM